MRKNECSPNEQDDNSASKGVDGACRSDKDEGRQKTASSRGIEQRRNNNCQRRSYGTDNKTASTCCFVVDLEDVGQNEHTDNAGGETAQDAGKECPQGGDKKLEKLESIHN